MTRKKGSGGARQNSGPNLKYPPKKRKVVGFSIPVSKEEDFRAYCAKKLFEYSLWSPNDLLELGIGYEIQEEEDQFWLIDPLKQKVQGFPKSDLDTGIYHINKKGVITAVFL